MRNPHGKSTRSRLPQNCAVCEFSFPKTSLLGAVSWKSVQRWKVLFRFPGLTCKITLTFLNKDRRGVVVPFQLQGTSSNFVDSAQVCIFCMQFFDKNFGVLVEPIPDLPPKKKKPLQQSVSYDDTDRILEYK